MAEATVKDALDGVIKNIGFGIVSDFRELSDAMREISSDMRDNNRLLDQTNKNISDTNRTLTDFEKNTQRAREFRLNRSAEDRLERRNRINGQRSEEMTQRIVAAIEELQRQVKMGARDSGEGEGGGLLGSILGGATAGTLMGGLTKAGKFGAVLAGVAALGAAGAYLMGAGQSGGEEEGGGSLSPASDASSGATPNIAAETLSMGTGVAAGAAAAGAAKAIIDRTTKTARQKALAKIAPKVPSYLSKFGGRITTIIGLKSVPVFGALVGGYFSFSRFMSGDSWTSIGMEFVSGVAPDVGAIAGAGIPGFAAGVATTLAIQTYLICRDIYQEENAIDIKNGIVPNFDDLDMSEKTQVVKAVGAYVEAYVNSLLGRSKTADTTTGISPSMTTGAGLAGAGSALPLTGAQPGVVPPTSDSTGGGLEPQAPPTPQSTGGATTQVAADIASNRLASSGGGGGPTSAESLYTSPESYAGGVVPERNESLIAPQAGVSPSDTMATLSTSSDQSSMYSGGEYGPILDYLADSEGADYNTQFNYQNTTGGRPLTEMTVAEVMEAQSKQEGSSAIGRYQFMRQTMLDGLNAGIISRDEVFSPQTQDRFATWLIDSKRKGHKWREGKMSNEEFGRALSQEWASVPNPYTGASYYGQGIKHDVGTLMNVLQSAKGPPPTPMAEGAKVTPLTSDKPSAGRDLSAALAPPKVEDTFNDEDTFTSSQKAMDLRDNKKPSGAVKEKIRNSISSYSDYMEYMFGTMPKEMMEHINGEVTADKAFKDAMNPLI